MTKCLKQMGLRASSFSGYNGHQIIELPFHLNGEGRVEIRQLLQRLMAIKRLASVISIGKISQVRTASMKCVSTVTLLEYS